jgi:hypothetical protein
MLITIKGGLTMLQADGDRMIEAEYFLVAVRKLLNDLKKKNEVSKESFAKKIGLNYQSLCSITTGKRSLTDSCISRFES